MKFKEFLVEIDLNKIANLQEEALNIIDADKGFDFIQACETFFYHLFDYFRLDSKVLSDTTFIHRILEDNDILEFAHQIARGKVPEIEIGMRLRQDAKFYDIYQHADHVLLFYMNQERHIIYIEKD